MTTAALAIATLVTGAGAAHAASSTEPPPLTCTGTAESPGTIAPGNYGPVAVIGFCVLPKGPVSITGSLTVTNGAALNAITADDVTVWGNVVAGGHAILALGCSPTIGCPLTGDLVHGNLDGLGALAVDVHGTTIYGSVSLVNGGGGRAAERCNNNPFLEEPDFSDLEDSTVYGTLTIDHLRSCWLGTLRVTVYGNMTVSNNTMGDPDAMEIVSNTVYGNLACVGNTPAVHVGDSKGRPNKVTGLKLGQCRDKGI